MTVPNPGPELQLAPNPANPALSVATTGLDQNGESLSLWAVAERMLTIFLNGREVVTVMTVGDNAEYLALGFLLNQRLLVPGDTVQSIDYNAAHGTVMVQATQEARPESGPVQRIHTSGCAVGTLFGGVMESLEDIRLSSSTMVRSSWLRAIGRKIDGLETLHRKTGSIHRCVLCQEDRLLAYVEDVGRHNALDALAGFMFLRGIDPANKSIYTTGRLTSEVVIKTVIMGVPVLVSRGGFTALGVDLARKTDLTMIGRCRGRFFQVLSGHGRIRFDAPVLSETAVPVPPAVNIPTPRQQA